MTENVVPLTLCPHCGYPIDRASSAKGGANAPRPGDLSICLACAGILIFGDDLRSRALNDSELAELDPRDRMLVDTIREVVDRFRGKTTGEGRKQ